MLSNRFAFALLAVACVAAAGGGGYLASRQSAVPAAQSAPAPAAVARPSASATPAVAGTTASEASSIELPAEGAVAKPTSPAARVPTQTAKRIESARAATTASKTAAPATNGRPVAQLSRAKTTDSAPAADRSQASAAVVLPPAVAPAPLPTPSAAIEAASSAPRADDRVAQESPRLPDPPQNTFEELVVSTDSVIGLQAETTVSSERARVEDRVEARVTRDVRVRNMVAIPAGTRAVGSVVSVERGGKFKERARLGIRFNTLMFADGTRLSISTETIYREGDPPGKDSSAKIGGATVGGAILGAILGGGKGAAIGATAGAGAGSAAVMNSDRSTATLRFGEPITIRIVAPVAVTIEHK